MKCMVSYCMNNAEHNHHVIPTMLDKNSKDVIPLCKKHHDILHNMIPLFYWDLVSDKESAKEQIKNKSAWFIENFVTMKDIEGKGAVEKKLKNLTCPNCRSRIETIEDTEVFDCSICGESFLWREVGEEDDIINPD